MNYNRLKNLYDRKKYPILPVKPGQYLEIHEKVWEEGNVRLWKFRWLVIKVKKPNHPDGTFTIRGTVARSTIEKIYPLSFEKFDKVLVLDEYKIRRAKLYYIRDKVGKDARFKSNMEDGRKDSDLWAEALADAESRFNGLSTEKVAEIVNEEEKVEVKIEEEKTEEVVEDKKEITD